MASFSQKCLINYENVSVDYCKQHILLWKTFMLNEPPRHQLNLCILNYKRKVGMGRWPNKGTLDFLSFMEVDSTMKWVHWFLSWDRALSLNNDHRSPQWQKSLYCFFNISHVK